MHIEVIDSFINKTLDESTPECPVWNVERIKSSEPPKWNYIDGCMISALLLMYSRTKDERFYDFAHKFMNAFIDENGEILGYREETYNLDNIFSGNALLEVYKKTGNEKYKKALKALDSQLNNQPRTYEGSYWHKLIYPNQVWLDGMYMAQVYRARRDRQKGTSEHSEDILHQFRIVRERMFDEGTQLYRHAYDASKKAFWADENGLSRNVWLRSMGWYAAALTDVCEALPDDMAEGKEWFKHAINELFEGIIKYIDKDSGMLLQVVNYPRENGNYPETSGSALIGYAMMKSARLGFVDKKWRGIGSGIFDSICRNYLREKDGKLSLGGICLVAGLGPESDRRRDGSFEYYMSEPVVENEAKGIAPFLYCYAESLQ